MGNVIQWFDDRLNPVMVKEVRQALNGREFISSFMFTIIVVLSISGIVLGIEAADMQQRAGEHAINAKGVFSVVLGCLAFASILIVPIIAYRSLDQERTERCYDLLIITTCGPGDIVRGKIYSAVIQLVLFFSATTPFLAAIYLIGNIDLAGTIFGLGWLFLASIFLTLVSLFNAAAASRTKRRSTPFVGNILLLILVFLMSLGWVSNSVYGDLSAHIYDRDFWLFNAASMTIFLSISLLIYAGIRAMVLFDSANRSTPVRKALALNWLLITGWHIVFHHLGIRFSSGAWIIYGIIVIVALWIYSLFTSCESDRLTRRVANEYPSGFFRRIFAAFFYPGSARGFYFTTLLTLITVGVVYIGNANSEDFTPVIMMAGYMLGYCGIPLALMRRRAIESVIKPANRGGLIFAISVAANILPLIAWAALADEIPTTLAGRILMVAGPAGGFIVYTETYQVALEAVLAPVFLGLAGIILNLRPFMRSALFRLSPEIPPQIPEDVSDAGALQ